MAHQESSMFCETCRRQVLCRRETANHLLHALITIFCTGGLWIPIWILCALDAGPWRCASCGSLPTLKQQVGWAGAGLLKFVAVVTAIGGVMIAITIGPIAWEAWDQHKRAPKSSPVVERSRRAPEQIAAPAAVTLAASPAENATATPPAATRGHLRDEVSDGREPATFLVHVREDHGATPSGDRARAFPAGAQLIILEERGDQVRVSVRGFEGWVEASAVERD